MNRVEIEHEYWEKEANGGNIDRAVCDPGLEGVCLDNLWFWFGGREKVLEIGCGVGRLLKLTPVVGNTTYYGIDISESMVNECKERLSSRSDIDVRLSDGRIIPFRDGTFDYVYSIAVFQHIDDDGLVQYLKEVFRVMKMTGTFRFQFVIGTEKTAFSWQRTENEMETMLSLCGFREFSLEKGSGFENWGWITASKIIKRKSENTSLF